MHMKPINNRLRRIPYTKHDEERQTPDRPTKNEERHAFERDRSRIIHSAAFRRLQRKTQLITVGEGDFLRTRLTHSLEVAQIGKGLALRLGANPDLVEAISLAHDIGHSPFGHAGEDELKGLMKHFGGFEANAQNIRILTRLENKSDNYEGLNLTRAVIDGQMKYKDTFSKDLQKFIYADDRELMDWASAEARNAAIASHVKWQSFECEIMEWADDIAYAVHDLEDSIHTGYINSRTFQDDTRIHEVIELVKKKFKDLDVEVARVCDDFRNDYLFKEYPLFKTFGAGGNRKQQKIARKELASSLIGRYIKAANRDTRASINDEPVSYRYLYRIHIPIQYRIEVEFIKTLIRKVVIESPQVRTLEHKGRHMIKALFCALMREDNVEALLPEDWRERLGSSYTKTKKARVVCDYISGMTDDYAQKTYARLFLPDKGSIYELL